jgi:hypothetical protein
MAYTEQVRSAWEAIFLLVVLKIPMVYLGFVIWWAIRAEPSHGDGGDEVGVLVPLTPCGWHDWKQRRSSRRLPRPLRPVGPHARRLAARAAAAE